MKKKIFLSLIIISSIVLSKTLFAQNHENYLNQLVEGKWKPKVPVNVVPMNDGERFAFVSKDKKQIIINLYKTDKESVLFDIDRISGCKITRIDGFEFDQNETRILIWTNTKSIYRHSKMRIYYIYNIINNRITPLSENGEQQLAEFSPNGRIVAFARDNNLFVKKLDFDTESNVTRDGRKNEIINGTADWVYEEEFARIKFFAFSPDNKLLAYIKFNEKDVNEFSMQIFNDSYPTIESLKYPKAGTENSKVSLWVYDMENRTTTKMNIEGEDFYIPNIQWTSSSDALAVTKLSRDQKYIELLSVNPRTGIASKLYSENSKTFCDYSNLQTIFNSDNSFVTMSEKDGFRHIYLFSPVGIQIQQLTAGNFDVTAFYGYDEKTKTAYFQAAKNNPTQREVYKSVNGKIIVLNNKKGMQAAKFSKGFKYAIFNYSDIQTPNNYFIINNSGKVLRVVENNKVLADKLQQLDIPVKKFFKFTTSEGIELNGWIMEPLQMSKNGNTKVVLTQYSGPDSQRVLNRWDYDWEQYLALRGFVVVCVDGRGTGARGNEFRSCTYGQLGILEARDQIETARYIEKLYNNAKIGIWGWSYGGFMTLKCMTSDNSPFKAGIAIAPVTDWKLYNTAYTERFMNRPQENFEGYKKTSVLDKADKLQGRLLLIHGTADDNVHAQQTYLMAEQLVEAGKLFEMMIYTNKNHSIIGAKSRYNIYKHCADFFESNLK